MSTANSRLVLDWLRTWSIGKLDAIGRTDITSNMNLPLTSDVRVNAAVTYMLGVVEDARTAIDASYTWNDDEYRAIGGAAWYELKRTMPADVSSAWNELWADPDLNALTLMKLIMRAVKALSYLNWLGG